MYHRHKTVVKCAADNYAPLLAQDGIQQGSALSSFLFEIVTES